MSSLVNFLKLIKFSHTLFALPFALASFVLALGFEGARIKSNFDIVMLLWVVAAMVGMRSAAMSFNRLMDADIDAKNPRTQNREIPSGVIAKSTVVFYLIIFSALFFIAAWQINPLALKLSPIPYAICLFYTYCKRFTSLCHLVLGVALGLSPLGAWVAVREEIHEIPLLMGIAVMLWTAGFDILYACMDAEFDMKQGLHSIPSKLGIKNALTLAKALHFLMIAVWALMIQRHHYSWPLWAAWGIILILVVLQHALVKIDNLKRMNLVFFKLNVAISLIILVGSLLEVSV